MPPAPHYDPPFPTENLENAEDKQAGARPLPGTPSVRGFAPFVMRVTGGLIGGAVLPLLSHNCHEHPPTSRKPTVGTCFYFKEPVFPPRACACVPRPSAGDVVLPQPLPAVFLWRVPRCFLCRPRLSSFVLASAPRQLHLWALPVTQAKAGLTAGRPGGATGSLLAGRSLLRGPWLHCPPLPARHPPSPWPLLTLQACRTLRSARSGLQL